MHFKFRVLIGTEEYYCNRDRFLLTGMCSRSRDILKFWEISIISRKWCKIEI